MLDQFSRTQLLYGRDAMDFFASCCIAVFGIGGVGGYVVEALARSGIGALDLIDNDKVCLSNINRQILATGNKLHPAEFEVADIYETSICPLAKVMRRECRKRGIESLKVVYSKEEPIRPTESRDIPGSTAFVPSVVGLIIAGEVINDLAAKAESVGKISGLT